MPSDLKTQMLHRLVDSGDWMSRLELVADLSSSPPAIEDALSDLVIEGKAEYRSGAGFGYRLAGGVMARRAAWLLRRRRNARAVYGERVQDNYQVGVAEMRRLEGQQELTLVMYEVSVPLPPDDLEHLDECMQRINAVRDFSMREFERG